MYALTALDKPSRQSRCFPGRRNEDIMAAKKDAKKVNRAGKAELVKALATSVGLTQAQAGAAVDAMASSLVAHAKKGSVNVPGLGSFAVVKTAARTGVKPGTSEKIKIPAGKKLKFSASSTLKGNL
jgi:DNA-binding protein HU-beta